MIADAETAIKEKNVYIRFPTEKEATDFFNDLHVSNKSIDDRIITFNFPTVEDAKDFHMSLISKFGDRTDPKVTTALSPRKG